MTTTLTITNAAATLEGPPQAIASAKRALSYRPKGYTFAPSYKKGYWDGWRTLMRPNGSFPAGLAADVDKALKRDGYEVQVVDKRGEPPESLPMLTGIASAVTLDAHQQEAINAIRRYGRGVVYQAVSAGKSVIIAEAIRQIGVPALVVVGRKELLKQQYDRCIELGIPHKYVGVLGNGEWRPGLVTIATIQTLRQKLKLGMTTGTTMQLLRAFKAVHIDECHHLPAQSYEMLMGCLPNAYYRVGYSATPHKSGKSVGETDKEAYFYVTGMTGPVISYLSPTDNIEAGRSVGADIFMVDAPGPDPEEIESYIEYTDSNGKRQKKPKYSYPLAVKSGIINNDERNAMIVRLAERLSRHGPTIVLTERVDHGKMLRSMLAEVGEEVT